MKDMMRRRGIGFTLIELLVVIAIIGILAAMLFPSVSGIMLKAKAVKMGSNGKEIWKALQSESLDRAQIDLASVWPTSGQYGSKFSTDFFKDCIVSNYMPGFDFSFFSGPGRSAAPGTNSAAFSEANNAWDVTLDVGESTLANVPFIFSRNITIGSTTLDGTPSLNGAEIPFGDKVCVSVTFGGSVQTLKTKELDTKFNPTVAKNKYLKPK